MIVLASTSALHTYLLSPSIKSQDNEISTAVNNQTSMAQTGTKTDAGPLPATSTAKPFPTPTSFADPDMITSTLENGESAAKAKTVGQTSTTSSSRKNMSTGGSSEKLQPNPTSHGSVHSQENPTQPGDACASDQLVAVATSNDEPEASKFNSLKPTAPMLHLHQLYNSHARTAEMANMTGTSEPNRKKLKTISPSRRPHQSESAFSSISQGALGLQSEPSATPYSNPQGERGTASLSTHPSRAASMPYPKYERTLPPLPFNNGPRSSEPQVAQLTNFTPPWSMQYKVDMQYKVEHTILKVIFGGSSPEFMVISLCNCMDANSFLYGITNRWKVQLEKAHITFTWKPFDDEARNMLLGLDELVLQHSWLMQEVLEAPAWGAGMLDCVVEVRITPMPPGPEEAQQLCDSKE